MSVNIIMWSHQVLMMFPTFMHTWEINSETDLHFHLDNWKRLLKFTYVNIHLHPAEFIDLINKLGIPNASPIDFHIQGEISLYVTEP